MIIDCDRYRVCFESIKISIKNDDLNSAIDKASVLANTHTLHIIVVYAYIGEIKGYSNNLMQKIADLMAYYHVDEVDNLRQDVAKFSIKANE